MSRFFFVKCNTGNLDLWAAKTSEILCFANIICCLYMPTMCCLCDLEKLIEK